MKKFFAILSMLFLLSCSQEDNSVQEQKCYITKFNQTTIKNTGQQFYLSEYIYDGNRIIKKMDYKLIDNTAPGQQYPTYAPELDKTIEVQYNNLSQPVKIIEPTDLNNIQSIEYIMYDNQGRLSEKNRVSTNFTDGSSYTKNFKYFYDSGNKIISIAEKTTSSWGDVYGENSKTLTYDTNGNLRMIEQMAASNPNYKIQIKYDNYDTYKNPYANVNVPFEDIFFLRLSKNNHRKYSKITIYTNNSPNNPTPPYEFYEISGYQYNENGYPRFAEYLCH
ncbi:hypothetical protein [Chryseobacterium hagamense]|uniref:DUF4595 domain-containing protein n=1 Tax=Chryseobacterium hagamense TaxID=395935 RepID=A0A511YML3_9FLAO|nr:hypothetical protein [Chryseobacterium hagamense]GEN76444.1 hypothetical protein CHA01nite_21840 [Chryseobacterium hagamense]